MRGMLTASALAIALIFVPFASIVTYPCNLFVTLVHESSHALAALATGGSVESRGGLRSDFSFRHRAALRSQRAYLCDRRSGRGRLPVLLGI